MRTTPPTPPNWNRPAVSTRLGSVWARIFLALGLGAIVLIPIFAWRASGERYLDSNYSERHWCHNNLQNIAYALTSYYDEHGSWPPRVIRDVDGTDMLSWRALLLTRLEYGQTVHMDQPWDSAPNLEEYQNTGEVFSCPSLGQYQTWGVTNYFMLVAEGADENQLKSNDFVIVELSSNTPWTQPSRPTWQQFEFELSRSEKEQYAGHQGGIHVARSNGEVHFIRNGELWANGVTSTREFIEYLRQTYGGRFASDPGTPPSLQDSDSQVTAQ